MASTAVVNSYLTVDATFNGLRILATPLLWEILEWLAIPPELQVSVPQHNPVCDTLKNDVEPYLASVVNSSIQRSESQTRSLPDDVAVRSQLPPPPAPPSNVVVGSATRVRVAINNPAIFLAEDLTNPCSPALGLTANMKAWVDMSPASDMAVCVDADNVRGMRVEQTHPESSTSLQAATWPS